MNAKKPRAGPGRHFYIIFSNSLYIIQMSDTEDNWRKETGSNYRPTWNIRIFALIKHSLFTFLLFLALFLCVKNAELWINATFAHTWTHTHAVYKKKRYTEIDCSKKFAQRGISVSVNNLTIVLNYAKTLTKRCKTMHGMLTLLWYLLATVLAS